MGFKVTVNDASETTIVGQAAPDQEAAAPANVVKKGDRPQEVKRADEA